MILKPKLKAESYKVGDGNRYYFIVHIDPSEMASEFQEALYAAVKKAQVYKRIDKPYGGQHRNVMESEIEFFPINTEARSNDRFDGLVKVSYTIRNENGLVVDKGDIEEVGSSDIPFSLKTIYGTSELWTSSYEIALAKAAVSISNKLLENRVFIANAMEVARDSGQYSVSSPNLPINPSFSQNSSMEKTLEYYPSDIPTKGVTYALAIGNNRYQYMSQLKTAAIDAQVVSKLLEGTYGYKTETIIDGSRVKLTILDDLRGRLKPSDNLLIYYAGHGYFDKKAMQGYWLPVDAKPKNICQLDLQRRHYRTSESHRCRSYSGGGGQLLLRHPNPGCQRHHAQS